MSRLHFQRQPRRQGGPSDQTSAVLLDGLAMMLKVFSQGLGGMKDLVRWTGGGPPPRRHGEVSAVPNDYPGTLMDSSHMHVTPPWKPEYKGQANMHVFEDWCGSSTDQLRRNPLYPLYPHSRATVQKLAVAPGWTNYGLRIFGYLHPYVDGEYLFTVASDDNSEFWLSLDHTPIRSQRVALVGKAGSEWAAPGEFDKYASQVSRPIRLRAKERYFFEVLHKQNDKGTDHVEVAWRLRQAGWRFTVIDSKYISLYTNESALKMNEVGHIPLSPASHPRSPLPVPHPGHLGIDMLRDDPRDSLYQVPLVDEELLQGVLPTCSYKPSYLIRGFALLRYQGLQFIHMTYVYPNDYTRLTHMESDNKCFYENTDRSGFSKYMKIDDPELNAFQGGPRWRKRQVVGLGVSEQTKSRREPSEMDLEDSPVTVIKETPTRPVSRLSDRSSSNSIYRWKRRLTQPPWPSPLGWMPTTGTVWVPQLGHKVLNERWIDGPPQQKDSEKLSIPVYSLVHPHLGPGVALENPNSIPNQTYNSSVSKAVFPTGAGIPVTSRFPQGAQQIPRLYGRRIIEDGQRVMMGRDGELGDDDMHQDTYTSYGIDRKVNWRRTFDVKQLDFRALPSDRINLGCNVTGNLLLPSEDALHVVGAFMEKVNQKNQGRFSLLRVLNVEKRLDGAQGSRYLLELEVRDRGGATLRLSRYVYLMQVRSTSQADGGARSRPGRLEPVLCHPLGLSWNPVATVHFVIPVKNQARWVQRFIEDMEEVYRATQDKNFNVIISDFNSTDMDVELALKGSALPRYQYTKLTGNFERSAGLQAGINMIDDEHSIVFLCDLHIHFPQSIIDSIRKHCVEGKMAFAPVVMRLDCGATPAEPRGFWEVNGFGLLGIYKSDLDAAGGMNTQEFRDRWGGEDWELLDRILQAGLEVERIYLRHFLHYYHSKRGMWNRKIL
nr:beta-1,4-N-acetylgalactosaminyltransferase 3-like isoform X2 [Paramormyrops kingsleyae]